MRTLFLSDREVFPKLEKGIPVVRHHERDERNEVVIMQGINPFSQELNSLVKHHQIDLCVVCYACSYPTKFLDDLANAGLGATQVMIITCPCSKTLMSRVASPVPLNLSLRLDGACKDQGTGIIRAMFEQWLVQGSIDLQKFSKTG